MSYSQVLLPAVGRVMSSFPGATGRSRTSNDTAATEPNAPAPLGWSHGLSSRIMTVEFTWGCGVED